MDPDRLNKLIKNDAKNGHIFNESEDIHIIQRSTKLSFIVGLIFASILAFIQSLIVGWPNFGIFAVVFFMLTTSQSYKSYQFETLKKDLLLICLEALATIIFTCLYFLMLFHAA